MPRLRTGFSFRQAVGTLPNVMDRLKEVEWPAAPITDRGSTFGWVKWEKLAKENDLKPVYGVELAVVESIHEKKPTIDYWTFLAIDSVEPINQLLELATEQFRYQPLLTYGDAVSASGVYKIVGHRAKFDQITNTDHMFYGITGACAKGHVKRAWEKGLPFVAVTDNYFPRPEDQGFYEIVCGRGANTQTYDQFIQDDGQWSNSIRRLGLSLEEKTAALLARGGILKRCKAELQSASLVTPPKPKSLREMCVEGAFKMGIDLEDPVYKERLDRELSLIKEKDFEDYFYLVADLCQWARQTMAVGPARGSSCGSLVCYLLEITTVDPIPHGLIFERFIDVNRSDLPDIDIDFSDQQRSRVFDYLRQTYGEKHVARLGTVAMYKARSALQEAGAALKAPRWKCDAAAEALIERSSADARATDTLEDTLNDTQPGKELIKACPEISIATKMEGHPRHYSQHAAGAVVASEPIAKYVAVDHRTNATQCDKDDAEGRLGLLKMDLLGLTQLSVLEDALAAAAMSMEELQRVPLDDPAAFEVLQRGEFSGVFQWNGRAVQSLTQQITVDRFTDIVAISALARPGPLATGGSTEWTKRRMGGNVPPGLHPMLDDLTKETYGVVVYQEQVMRVVREMGKLSWADTSSIRKAMSKSMGDEFFAKFKEKFVAGAMENGVEEEVAGEIWDQINTFGCLSGDTVIDLADPNQHSPRQLTIKELYENGGYAKIPEDPGNWNAQRKRGKANLYCMTGDYVHGKPAIRKSRIADIWQSGVKVTWRVDLGDRSIRATLDHKFLTEDGWKRLGDICNGERIAVKGPKHKDKKWKGTGQGAHNHWQGQTLEFIRKVEILKEEIDTCQMCKRSPYEETHHIDHDRLNNDWDNLLPVCRKCHKFFHDKPVRYSRGWQIEWRYLISVSYPREEVTYDISMEPDNNYVAEGILTHNSWAFNKSHAVSYGFLSYWCCWLKAHFPFEFTAATLSHENDPAKQIELLREMKEEGYDYIPVDKQQSTDKWTAGERDGQKVLIGPLQNVRGIGPALVTQIIEARDNNSPMPAKADKLLNDPVTDLDSLTPIQTAIERVMPDPGERNIHTPPTPVKDIKPSSEPYEVMVFVTPVKINPRNENENAEIMKRGYRIEDGKTDYLQMQLADDTGIVRGKINRWNFERIGRTVINTGRPSKSLWAFKGKVYTVGDGFLVLSINKARYIGDTEK